MTDDFPYIPPGSYIGPYVIDAVLSKDGNMSRIYAGRNELGRRVAIKIARSDDELFTTFLRDEVAQLVKTGHPAVVHIYPIELAPGKKVYIARGVEIEHLFNYEPPYYYVMEMIAGGSMYTCMDTLLHFPLSWRIELLYQIALGIEHLHQIEIAHRDIKPNNIVFRTRPDLNNVKRPDPVVVDFGIASRHNEDPHAFAATYRYAAPEVIERLSGQRANYRTTMTSKVDHLPADVWSLGVMAYELITGEHPFEPFSNDDELAEAILHRQPNPMPGVGSDVQRIILGDPAQRDPYVGLLEGMLSKVREHRPVISEIVQYFDTQTQFLPPRY